MHLGVPIADDRVKCDDNPELHTVAHDKGQAPFGNSIDTDANFDPGFKIAAAAANEHFAPEGNVQIDGDRKR